MGVWCLETKLINLKPYKLLGAVVSRIGQDKIGVGMLDWAG